MLKKIILISLLGLFTACTGKVTHDYHPQTPEERRENDMKSIVTGSDEPIVLFGGKKKSGGNNNASGMAGSYLWRASLECISFMPLVSSDSNGGAILTDWYSNPQTPNERFKFNIIILNSELEISSIKVTAFKQVYSNGKWHSAKVSKELSQGIEDKILKKAISLKVKAAEK